MGLGQLNHVAIAVNNLKESTKLYKDVLGATVSNPLVSTLDHLFSHSLSNLSIEN